MNTATLLNPAHRSTHPWRNTLASAPRALWSALEAFGQRRAAGELLLLADRLHSSDPATAQLLRTQALAWRAGRTANDLG